MNETTRDQLIQSAIKMRQKAYCPYSDFAVGAALLCSDGTVFEGCNVENSSYGLSICAERNAICQAVAKGFQQFTAISIAASPLATPCGACRQFLAEFGTEIQVICVDPAEPSHIRSWTVGELIPESFRFDG